MLLGHLALATAVLAMPSEPAIPWRRDLPQAVAEAEERRRPLLIRFDVDPCGRYILPGETDALGRRVQGEIDLSECDRMEKDVWSREPIARSAARFVPILTGDTALRTLQKRYNVLTSPTVVVADPWGNEIVRMVGYTDRAMVQKVLDAIPDDFRAAENDARALQGDRQDVAAVENLARFYEGAGLREFADRYYERAQLTDPARRDPAARRKIVVARGTNLILMGKPADAAAVFRKEAEGERDGPLGDAVFFGWLMAELRQGRVKDADRPYRELLHRFPESKYTAKAKENMTAAASPK